MRNFHLPNVFGHGLVVGSLAVATSLPTLLTNSLFAAEPSAVGFVDRAALNSSPADAYASDSVQPAGGVPMSENGWRQNPLRAGSNAGAVEVTGNTLRQQVQPASYEAPSQRTSGLQTRPHTEQTGIFSGWMGGGSKQQARPQTSSPAQPRMQSQVVGKLQSTPTVAPAPRSAASQAMSYLPKFQTNAAKRHAQAAAAKANGAVPTAPRTAMAQPPTTPARRPATSPTQLMATGGNRQASYNSAAAAAQSYQPRSNAMATATAAVPQVAGQPAKRRAWYPPENPNPNTAQAMAYVRPPAGKTATSIARTQSQQGTPSIDFNLSVPAEALAAAHEFAATAKTEADFSKIFDMCQQIPASKASQEEAAFGRQLAAWSLNRRGQVRARAGRSDEAMADFTLAVRVDAKCWRAIHNRGVLSAQAGQFEAAFDDFHRTVELNPKFAKAFANRAALYVLAGELEPARADYEKALELDPNFAVAHRGCGRTCHMLGDVDGAYDHLSRAVELAPLDAAALASRGDLLTDLGDYANAANDYEAAIEASNNCIDAYRGSAWLLATCPDRTVRNPKLAVERAEAAVRLQKKADTATLDTLAAAQAAGGNFQQATQIIARAIELAPPSERSVYQDRQQLYRNSQPFEIAPLHEVQQAGFEQ